MAPQLPMRSSDIELAQSTEANNIKLWRLQAGRSKKSEGDFEEIVIDDYAPLRYRRTILVKTVCLFICYIII